MRVASPYRKFNPFAAYGEGGEDSVGGVVYPTSDATLQAMTGYASAATSLYRLNEATGATDLIGSNDLTDHGGVFGYQTYTASLDSLAIRAENVGGGRLNGGTTIFQGDSDVAGILIMSLDTPDANRIICGKGLTAGNPHWWVDCAAGAGGWVSTLASDGTGGGADVRAQVINSNLIGSNAMYIGYQFDFSVGQTTSLWTPYGDSEGNDISGLTSLNNTDAFNGLGGAILTPAMNVSLHVVYTGAAARGLTGTHCSNLFTAMGLG